MNPVTEGINSLRAQGVRLLAGISLLLMVVALLLVFHTYTKDQQSQSTMIIRDMARANDELNRGFLHLHLGREDSSPWQYENGPVLIWQAIRQYGAMAGTLANAAEVSAQLTHLQQHLTEMLAEVRAFTPLELQQAMYHHTGEASELDRQIRLVLEARSSRLDWLFSATTLFTVLVILSSGVLMFRAEKGKLHAIRRLLESESRLRELSERIADALWLKDARSHRTIYISPAYETLWGQPCAALLQDPDSWIDSLHPDDREKTVNAFQAMLTDPKHNRFDETFRIVLPDQSLRWIHDTAYPVLDTNGEVVRIAGIARDITRLRTMEEELQHAQRMEAIGHLTGGLAHDFNNLLTVILGNADLLREQIQDQHLVPLARIISMAAHRGAELTQQLLAFARQQTLEPRVIDPQQQIAAMHSLLARSIGEHIRLQVSAEGSISPIKVDPARFENALLNICINARDAMPEGGRIDISLRNTSLKSDDSNGYSQAVPGHYVELAVTDTGKGIAPELLSKVFDPFFTTKDKGKGTGLGLSMVFGFVRQSGGHICLESTPGKGTRLALYLPVSDAPVELVPSPVPRAERGFRAARILLAEDDPLVREYAGLQLRNAGYEVTSAVNGAEALNLLQDESFDLLFTDVLMPEMNGPELARHALQLQPTLGVIYTSGFFEDGEMDQVLDAPLTHLLAKPYQREDLLALVAEVLNDRNGTLSEHAMTPEMHHEPT